MITLTELELVNRLAYHFLIADGDYLVSAPDADWRVAELTQANIDYGVLTMYDLYTPGVDRADSFAALRNACDNTASGTISYKIEGKWDGVIGSLDATRVKNALLLAIDCVRDIYSPPSSESVSVDFTELEPVLDKYFWDDSLDEPRVWEIGAHTPFVVSYRDNFIDD